MPLPLIATPTYTLIQPSTGKQISFRPFLVKEEKILLMAAQAVEDQESQREIVNAIQQIIQNCCEGLGDVDRLPLFDLEYIFLQLRSKSVGETIEPEIRCPNCKLPVKIKVDLSKVQVIKPTGHETDIRITNEVGVKMKYPSFEVFQTRLLEENVTIDRVFDVLVDCIDSIYTKDQVHKAKDYSRKELMDFLESLSQEQFQRLQKFFETSPRLEHTANYSCPNQVEKEGSTPEPCGYKGQIVLRTLTDFFV